MPVLTESWHHVKCDDCGFEYESESLVAVMQEAEKHLEGYWSHDSKEVESHYDHELRLTRYELIKWR